jgi:hypothetical protein
VQRSAGSRPQRRHRHQRRRGGGPASRSAQTPLPHERPFRGLPSELMYHLVVGLQHDEALQRGMTQAAARPPTGSIPADPKPDPLKAQRQPSSKPRARRHTPVADPLAARRAFSRVDTQRGTRPHSEATVASRRGTARAGISQTFCRPFSGECQIDEQPIFQIGGQGPPESNSEVEPCLST